MAIVLVIATTPFIVLESESRTGSYAYSNSYDYDLSGNLELLNWHLCLPAYNGVNEIDTLVGLAAISLFR